MQNKFNIIVPVFTIVLCHLLQSDGLLSNGKSPPKSKAFYQFGAAGGRIGGGVTYWFQNYKPKSTNESITFGFTWTDPTFSTSLLIASIYNLNFYDVLQVRIDSGRLEVDIGRRLLRPSTYHEFKSQKLLEPYTYYELKYYSDGHHIIVKLDDEVIANYTSAQQFLICKNQFIVGVGNKYFCFNGTLTKLVVNGEDILNSREKISTPISVSHIGDIKYVMGESCDDQDCSTSLGSEEPDESLDISTVTTDETLEPQTNTSPVGVSTLLTTEPQYSHDTTEYATTERVFIEDTFSEEQPLGIT